MWLVISDPATLTSRLCAGSDFSTFKEDYKVDRGGVWPSVRIRSNFNVNYKFSFNMFIVMSAINYIVLLYI